VLSAKAIRNEGGTIVLIHPQPNVEDALKTVGLDMVIPPLPAMPTAPLNTLLETPGETRSSNLVRRREFTGSLLEAAATVAWIERIADEQKWPHRVAFVIQVCAEELLTNIVCHGAAESTDIAVELSEGVNQVRMTIEVHGPPFDIAAAVPRRFDRPLEELEPGGLGVQLVHHFSDQLSYQRRRGANCTIAVFKLLKPEPSAP